MAKMKKMVLSWFKWAKETKMGFGWATLVVVVLVITTAASIAYDSAAPLILPVLIYLGFLYWINRAK